MSGYFNADRGTNLLDGGKVMAKDEYRKGVDEHNKEPEETKEGEEKGQLSHKKHFGKGGMAKDGGKKKHSRKSSRR